MELTWAALLVLFLPTIQAITNAATSSYIHVPGKTLPGPFPTHSFKIKMSLTLNQCAAECSLEYHLKRFPCYAFEYATASKTCVLTNITTLIINGGYLGLRNSPVMDFYERSKGAYLNLFQPVHNKVLQDQKSYFAIFYNMTREKCALFCLIETRDTCMSFSYSAARQVCGLSKLFYTKTNGQVLTPSSLYDHYQYSTTWPCNATIPWSYSPTAIASPYFPYASLKDVNCHVIIEAPVGKQIDLQFSTFFTQRNICDGDKNGLIVIDGQTPSSQNVLKTLCNSDNFVSRRFMSTSGYLYVQFATGSVPMAFKAVYNFVSPDPCSNSPCQNGGNCSAVSSGFVCACAPGYTGSLCETDVDECASAPCLFGGQCIDKVDSFECVCPSMLGGHRCDLFVGLCSEQPCQNGAKCSPRGQNNYICECQEGFVGKNCSETAPHDPCDSMPCQNSGTCQSLTSDYTCACAEGFTGTQCETNIDDCENNPCYFNVPCLDLVNDYRCECPAILSGKRCETFIGKCSENPCVNGHCSPLQRDNYTCSCFAGFMGRNCTEKTFNFCNPNPCRHGSCTSYANGPSCSCDFDYEGLLCDRRINHCSHVNCNKGECRNLEGDFRCDCIEGYTGRFCNETIDHCRNNSCGTGKCINTMTNYFCLCDDGQTGKRCQSSIINQNCSVDTCVHGICTKENGTSKCICVGGYVGEYCNQVDHCISNSCIHGACANQPDGYTCSCDPGYTGADCSHITDHCKEAGCVYGLCQNRVSGFTCICAVGYHGDLCQYREGETGPPTPTTSKLPTYSEILSTRATTAGKTFYCGAKTCINGVCSDVLKDSCSCYDGFTGQRCEIFVGCGVYNPCYHDGACTETGTGFSCSCVSNYTGQQCETPLTDPEYSSCDSSLCLNNGTCSTDGNHCICTEEFTGDRCQFFNICRSSPCITGRCVQTGNRIRCEITPLVGHSNTSLGLPFMPATQSTTDATVVPVPQRSDIDCRPDSISVYIPQSLLSGGQNVTWRDENCSVTFNVTHYTDTVKLTACGTTVGIDDHTITFSNDLIVHKTDDKLSQLQNRDITFGEGFETVIPVKCVYARENNLTSSYAPIKQHVRFVERRHGQLDLSLEQYQTAQFKTLVPSTGNPRKVPLNGDIYLRVGLDFPVKDLRVKVDQCIATSTPSPSDINWHQLIKSGCPIKPVRLLSSPVSQDVKFSFKAFDFRHNSSGFVYIHCEVTVCRIADPNCMMGCANRTKRAASVNPFGGSHLLSTGPFVMAGDNVKEGGVSSALVFAGACLSLAVIAVGVAILGWTRKSRLPQKVDGL